MKILYVFGGEKASGAEIVIERLMQKASHGAEVTLFLAPGTFADSLLSEKKPYEIYLLKELKKLNRSSSGRVIAIFRALCNYVTVSYKIFSFIRKQKTDLVHANTIVPATYLIPALVLSKVFFFKTLWVWSDHDLKYFKTIDAFFSKLSVLLYHHTFVVSKAVKNKYQSNKVSVLYNGLDTGKFKEEEALRNAFRESHNISQNQIAIGIAALIAPRKGQLMLINVFNSLLIKYPNTLLLIAGEKAEDDNQYVQDVLSMIEFSKNIKYLGKINDVLSFYGGCDIIINNSSNIGSEPLGTTIYEAMACKKIVIAANTGGTTEIIDNNFDGFTFIADEEDALLNAILNVLENFDVLLEVKINARKKVLDRFDINIMYKNYITFINNLRT